MGVCCSTTTIEDPKTAEITKLIHRKTERTQALAKTLGGINFDDESVGSGRGRQTSVGQLNRIWKLFDKNGDGTLDKKELQVLLRKFLTIAQEYVELKKTVPSDKDSKPINDQGTSCVVGGSYLPPLNEYLEKRLHEMSRGTSENYNERLSLGNEDMGSALSLTLKSGALTQDFESHLVSNLGLAIASQFGDENILSRFEVEPEIVTDEIFNLLDPNGNGEIERWEFLQEAPKVLFNEAFFERTAEVYSKDVWEARLKQGMIFQHEMNLCTLQEMRNILLGCPKYLYWLPWVRMYSSAEDGISFTSFKSKIEYLNECLVIIRTLDGFLIGGFASEQIVFDNRVHGNVDNFVFSKPPFTDEVDIYPATDEGSCKFHIGSYDALMFGPDDVGCALYLSKGLLNGRTEYSGTYFSPSLVPGSDFIIQGIEVWGPRD